MSRYKPLLPIVMIFIVLLGFEIPLELRHYFRCFDTLIFGQHDCGILGAENDGTEESSGQSGHGTIKAFGPVQDWPYRSKIPDKDITDEFVVWIASASHAEHSRLPAETIFPNQICGNTELDDQCIVVNGSRAGNTIAVNLESLENSRIGRNPDVAILYQMAIFIAAAQSSQVKVDNSEKDLFDTGLSYDGAVNQVVKYLQRTSLYLHLSEYIGSTIKLGGFRADKIDGVKKHYIYSVDKFVSYCRSNNIVPILTTFATAYNQLNINTANKSMLRTLVRQNRKLSTTGYVNTVAELNVAIGAYAVRENVQIIDIDAAVGGKFEYFVDMVHLNSSGHSVVASTIADALKPRISQRD